uniref:Calmodulin n=1 Tax=Lotharella globosa TaxID=91324 RepID=A0A7S3ZDK0_9EUKA
MQKQFDFSQFGPFTNKEVRKAFDSFDLDKNGFIGVGELRTIYTAIGEEVTDAELDEMIKMVDTDGDGQCDFSEFQKMIFRYAERAYDEDEISDTGDEKDEGAHRDTKHSVVVKKPVKESKALDTKKRAAHLREVISKLKISQETIDAVFKKFTKSDKPSIMYTEFCELMERPKSKDMAELFGLFGKPKSLTSHNTQLHTLSLTRWKGNSRKPGCTGVSGWTVGILCNVEEGSYRFRVQTFRRGWKWFYFEAGIGEDPEGQLHGHERITGPKEGGRNHASSRQGWRPSNIYGGVRGCVCAVPKLAVPPAQLVQELDVVPYFVSFVRRRKRDSLSSSPLRSHRIFRAERPPCGRRRYGGRNRVASVHQCASKY